MEKPLVSIICVTYNHELYISKAIDSFIMQKTSFPVEIIIGEDHSTDKTLEICQRYQKMRPDKIRLITSERNVGAAVNWARTMDAAQGKYFAYCEGDDYWTDPLKLQKQVDFLEAHQDFSIASHKVRIINEETDKKPKYWAKPWSDKDWVTIEDIITDGGAATGSLVWRNKAFGEFPDWFMKQAGGDWSLQILCASKGGMKYFSESMGAYRMHNAGAMSARVKEAREKGIDITTYHFGNMNALVDALDNHFSKKYSALFDISRRMNYWGAFSGYLHYGDVDKAKAYTKKIIFNLPHYPAGIIIKIVAKLALIYIFPRKIIPYIYGNK